MDGSIFPYSESILNYLVHCSLRHRYVYVETPKVACSTVKRALQVIEFDGNFTQLGDDVHDRSTSPLLSPQETGKDYTDIFQRPDFFRFSFVRNPYSRILSAYLDKIVINEWERSRMLPILGFSPDQNITFREFLVSVCETPDEEKDIHWMPQSVILQKKIIKYDFLGYFEYIEPAIMVVLKKILGREVEPDYFGVINYHKTGAKEKIDQFVGAREQELILRIYEADFVEFGFSEDPQLVVA